MKQQIDNLVALTLIEEGAVYLPERGSLVVYRVPAKRLSDKSMQKPFQELRYVAEERGCSLVEHIARVANVDAERAVDIYHEWLAQSTIGGILAIGGVAAVGEDRSLKTESLFEEQLNPQGRGVVALKPRAKTNSIIFAVVGIVMLCVVGAGGYMLYDNGVFGGKKVAVEPVVEPVIEPVVEPIVEPVVEPVVEPKDPDVLELKKGYSYVSWGVYAEKANALKYKAMLRRIHPTLNTNIYDYDGRYMVAIFESQSRALCNRKVASWREMDMRFDVVWVYTR